MAHWIDEEVRCRSGGPKYQKLEGLARKAGIGVILELFVALDRATNVESRDRLTQAITFVMVFSPWSKPLGLDAFVSEVMTFVDCQTLAKKILQISEELPLTWSKESRYEHYSSLSGGELLGLTNVLLEQKSLRQKLGSRIILAQRYFKICEQLLEIAVLNENSAPEQDLEERRDWQSFLVSSEVLGSVLDQYWEIENEFSKLGLPKLPVLNLGDGNWLLSDTLITGTLLVTFVQLLEGVQLQNWRDDQQLAVRADLQSSFQLW